MSSPSASGGMKSFPRLIGSPSEVESNVYLYQQPRVYSESVLQELNSSNLYILCYFMPIQGQGFICS